MTHQYTYHEDELETFWGILSPWGAASTAKFNEHKTVILPFGRGSYQEIVLKDRRINKKMKLGTIDQGIRILPDGQSCRMLGAWIGNNIPYITP
jgi:hypothetical protein